MLKMTAEQTAIYDNGTEDEQASLMRNLRAQARKANEETGEVVEIITADGITADVVQ